MNKCLSIITLNVNALSASFKRHRVAEWIRKQNLHICCLPETHLSTKTPTQTESEGLEKTISSKWTGKRCWGNNANIRQNRLQNKGHKKRCRRTLHNTQGKNPPRRHQHCKYICTQHRSIRINGENLGELQERYRQQHIYITGF